MAHQWDKKPWKENTEKWRKKKNAWSNPVFEKSEFNLTNSEINELSKVNLNMNFTADRDGFASAAETLGGARILMKFYYIYQKKYSKFFFSPNPNLDSVCKKPKYFESIDSFFKDLTVKQRLTIAFISGYNKDGTDIGNTNEDLKKLQRGYQIWPDNLYSYFWDIKVSNANFMCNVFVGDAAYIWKKLNLVNNNNHYVDPKEIIDNNKGYFIEIEDKLVTRGTIYASEGGHTEIITEVKGNEFCSIGAGRGTEAETGLKKCEWDYDDKKRLLSEEKYHYFLIKI